MTVYASAAIRNNLENILDRHERSRSAVQLNGGFMYFDFCSFLWVISLFDLCGSCDNGAASKPSLYYILEDFENASLYFCTFFQTVYAIEKLLAGFNVQPRIGMNQSLI